MIVVPRAMKLKCLAACSLILGWCLATDLVSVENGTASLQLKHGIALRSSNAQHVQLGS